MNIFFLLVLAVPILVIVAAIVNTTFQSTSEGRPKGLPWIPLLFGVVVIGGIATFLITAMRSQELVIRVTGPAGAEFVGEVFVDGIRHELDGVAPKSFEFTGNVFDAIVLAVEPNSDDPLVVDFSGDFHGMGAMDPYGVRFTAFNKIVTSGAGWDVVKAPEWEDWIERLRPSETGTDPLLQGISAPSNTPSPNTTPSEDEVD